MSPSQTSSADPAKVRRVRGTGIPLMVAAARAAAGEAAWLERIQVFSPEVQAFLEEPVGLDTWVDADLVAECLAHLAGVVTLGSIPSALGAETMRLRHPEAFQDPDALIGFLPRIWAHSVEGGRLDAHRTGPASAEVEVWADWAVPLFFDTHLPGWLGHAFRLAGAPGAAVEACAEPPCRHRYRLTWPETL
ncbi:hypothetical protein [Mesoterricola sediminis]|uniref:Uncharacterized protein n=1 Tax=Mesoterricola sediminis TaxID=2927980 RepID=A0AA48GXM5_9BACT|nr:hypothetical protein [Mesoterricola sediminis]BDU78164.1 hypothetical protein METESE_31220 [Mesoterricola sediminis]